LLARKADLVVALGEAMRRMLIEGKGADPAKTIVIPDWADGSAIAPGSKENRFSLPHGLADKFVVMHSANIGLSQGLETLVEAAGELCGVPDLEVVFQGEGVQPALEEQAGRLGLPNVRFLAFAPKERLGESFAAADAFVISLKAGMAGYIVPTKLHGIRAAGRPYVAAVEDTSEVAAITARYECGLVVPPEKPMALAGPAGAGRDDPGRHPRGRHRAAANREPQDESALLGAHQGVREADRRAGAAQHLVQRERADRAPAGGGARLLPPDEDGHSGDGALRAGKDRQSYSGARGLGVDASSGCVYSTTSRAIRTRSST
jgi:hypothetical protein